ncbi:MAG: DUF459 domain-containing protein [Burkholderiaceae bacterium]|nr:DUF459 domain-containing protein [Burkholderiaceae bacterium]
MDQLRETPKFPLSTLFVLGATLALVCWLRHDALDTYWQQTRHGELGLTASSKDPLWVEGVEISGELAHGIDAGNKWLDMVGGRVTLATNIVLTGQEPVAPAPVAISAVTATPSRASLVPSTALGSLPQQQVPSLTAKPEVVANADHPLPPLSDDGRIVLTAQDKVLLVGDSMMQGVAPHVARALQKANIVSVDLSKQSTGLAYPSYFDWPATVQKAIPDSGISVMVVFLGANDTWDIYVSGRAERFGSEKWQSVYAQRIDSMVKFAESQNVRVVWLGAPNMGREKINSGVKILNHLYQSEASDGLARYVSTRELLSGGDDTDVYQKHITTEGGKTVTVRTDDGVHFTRVGQEMLSNLILRQFAIPSATPVPPPSSASQPGSPAAPATASAAGKQPS